MRIAVISDVHGNAHALEAVLEDVAKAKPDLVINLGDCLPGGLEPARTADMLIAEGFPTISGNHDRWLYDPPNGKFDEWEVSALVELTEEHLDWVRSLPPTRVIADEIFMCHATPHDDVTSWLDELDDTGEVHPARQDQIEARAVGCDYPLILCGHTHIPRAVSLADGRLVINPGSVGSPGFKFMAPHGLVSWSARSPHARYAIIEKSRYGWSSDFRAVAYNYEASADIALANGNQVAAQALLTGWVGD